VVVVFLVFFFQYQSYINNEKYADTIPMLIPAHTARTNLEKLATVLNKYPDTNIEILGHTDDRGTDAYNQRLSERRANSATAYLRTLGISSSRLKTRGLGESDPKVSNDTDAGRAENRRVEFVITANEKMIQDAKREAGQ
jgi:outer membrane protein OmpA-like peptidoglycan-associated protein